MIIAGATSSLQHSYSPPHDPFGDDQGKQQGQNGRVVPEWDRWQILDGNPPPPWQCIEQRMGRFEREELSMSGIGCGS